MSEQSRTLVVIYYSGHGLMEPDNTFKTCAELNEYVSSEDPDNPNGKLVYYPLQESIEILARKSNLLVFGIMECCRAALKPADQRRYTRHVPSWWESMLGRPNEGSCVLFHALQRGELLKDVSEQKNGDEEEK